MSDWIDLQLAHSLAPVKAPDQLWARIEAASAAAPARRAVAIRWAFPVAVAACALLLLARLAAVELRTPRAEFASNDAVAVEHWLAHEAGIPVPLRPSDGVHITGARMVKRGVAAVSYEVNGRKASVLVARGEGPSPCKIPGVTVVVAANATRSDAACRLCHSL